MSVAQKSEEALVLMEKGILSSDEGLEICRGMVVYSCEGHKIGHVAAVVVEPTRHMASQLLLVPSCHLPSYRSIPIECVELSADKEIRTTLFEEMIDSLPAWSCNPERVNSEQNVRTTKEKKMTHSDVTQAKFYPDMQSEVTFGESGPQPKFLVDDPKFKVILGGLKAGQQIPVHPESLAVYHFVAGTGTMTVDDEQFPISAGATVITPEGARRGMKAETEVIFLASKPAS